LCSFVFFIYFLALYVRRPLSLVIWRLSQPMSLAHQYTIILGALGFGPFLVS